MRKLAILILALALFISGDLPKEALAQVVPTSFVAEWTTFIWEPVTADIDASPITVDHYEFAVWSGPLTDANTTVIPPLRITTTTLPTLAAILALTGQKGGFYSFAVRAFNTAGDASSWSVPTSNLKFVRPPATPKNLRLDVRVIIK